MRRWGVIVILLSGTLLTGCVAEPGLTESPTPAPTASVSPPASPVDPSASSSTSATPTASANCWTIERPEVDIDSMQTPEEFTAQNQALVDGGAPAPCSLFSAGSHPREADQWIEALLAQGWIDQGGQEDDVYVSRAAIDGAGRTASYLVSKDSTMANAISQFQLY